VLEDLAEPHELQPPDYVDGGNVLPRGDDANRGRSRGYAGNAGNANSSKGRGQRTNNFSGNSNAVPGSNFNGRNQNRRDERAPGIDRNSGTAQPDPMKTSFGYIGADTFTRQRQGQTQRTKGGGNAGNGGNRNGNRNGGNRGGNR
jgi:23S rRNA pseudouridine2605 synthase